MCINCIRLIMANHTRPATADSPAVFMGIDLSVAGKDRDQEVGSEPERRVAESGEDPVTQSEVDYDVAMFGSGFGGQ